MAPGGSALKEVMESNSTGMDYEVKTAKVEVNNNKPTKPGSAGIGKYGIHSNNGVYELLECPVCTNLMYPPIHQCPNGHTLCSNCKLRVQNTCPTCRYELGNIRCLALEKVAESLEVPCRYQNLGCHDIFPYYSKLKYLKHPLDCTASEESLERLSKVARIEGFSDEESEEQQGLADLESMNPVNPRVQRYLVAIEYIGTRFSGSQQQAKDRTVVGVLQEAFHKFIGQPVKIFCSSRTDAGVHALSNVCHVDVERISKRKPGEVLPPHEPGVVQRAVNHFLQRKDGDVMVIDVRCVPSNYHARYKAQERTYFYRLLSGSDPLSILEKDRCWHVPEELNLRFMQEACRVLVGSHDFSSFRAAGCQAKSPMRSLDELNITEVPSTPYFPSITERTLSNLNNGDPLACSNQPKSETAGVTTNVGEVEGSTEGDSFGRRRRHRCYVVTARSRGFLYHQVRLIVGALKCVGTGELTVSDVERILEAKTVSAAKPMAPASGLYLARVRYEFP